MYIYLEIMNSNENQVNGSTIIRRLITFVMKYRFYDNIINKYVIIISKYLKNKQVKIIIQKLLTNNQEDI